MRVATRDRARVPTPRKATKYWWLCLLTDCPICISMEECRAFNGIIKSGSESLTLTPFNESKSAGIIPVWVNTLLRSLGLFFRGPNPSSPHPRDPPWNLLLIFDKRCVFPFFRLSISFLWALRNCFFLSPWEFTLLEKLSQCKDVHS